MPAASSLECPLAIAFQNGHRSARCNTGGRPGERSFARSDRAAFNFFALINTSLRTCCDDWLNSPCDPRSLWWIKLLSRSGYRAYSACSNASRTKSVRIELLTRQPTMRLANTSMTKAT